MKTYWWIIKDHGRLEVVVGGIMIGIVERCAGPYWTFDEAWAMIRHWTK